MKHTILEAGNTLGKILAPEILKDSHNQVRLVTEFEYWIPGTETVVSDISITENIQKCIDGSEIVYLFPGFSPLNNSWNENLLNIIIETVRACQRVDAKLVYIDTQEIYGKNNGKYTEETLYKPCSRNGRLFLDASMLVEKEMSIGNLKLIIARTADIYGPMVNSNSYLHENVFKKMINKKIATWYINSEASHSFTFSNDLARGILLLAMHESCFNQVWHLPTSDPLMGETFIHITSNILGIDPEYSVQSREVLRFKEFFKKGNDDIYDCLYRFESGIHFDSTKFNTYFNYTPVTYYNGIQKTIQCLKTA
jgi:nucleoside-diphosphate-sugar epimerase